MCTDVFRKVRHEPEGAAKVVPVRLKKGKNACLVKVAKESSSGGR